LWPTFLTTAGAAEPFTNSESDTLQDVAHGRSNRQYVYSQQGCGPYGLYLITDGRWKYSYSAADEQEWLYDLVTDPHETRNLAHNAVYLDQVTRLRSTLIGRFADAGYDSAVTDGAWRRYGKQHLNPDPDFGLLMPHPQSLNERFRAYGDGYVRDTYVASDVAFGLLEQAATYELPEKEG
jgi:hypothetical protein